MTTPVTESLVVHWRPSFQYHQRRLDLLAELRAEGQLEQWHVTPEHIGARTENVQIAMREDGFALHPRGTILSESALHLARLAFGCSSPPAYHFQLLYQFLIPIDGTSYDDARAKALDRITFAPLGASDFAIVIDGTAEDNEWHCEFGIVSEEEVEPRMRRWLGHAAQWTGSIPAFVELPQDIPSVALFIDLMWVASERTVSNDRDSVDQIALIARNLRDDTDQLVSGIRARVGAEALQPLGGGLSNE